MLILSRKPGDAILIDGGIRIVLIACDQRGARIGIEAPSSVGIVREEIVIEVADENRRASDASRARALLSAIADAPAPAAPAPRSAAVATDGTGAVPATAAAD